MQLTDKPAGRLTACLAALTASLFSVVSAHAQDKQPDSLMTEPAPGPGSTTVDTAILFYQEQGGRVRAIEPTASATIVMTNGDVLSGSFTYDSLTGATPSGAAPWTADQTFTALQPAPSTQVTTTSASGGRTVVTVPGTGLVQSSYTAPAGKIPLDYGFHDHRFAANLGYSWQLDPDTKLKIGGALSFEHDYRSYSGNLGISRDLNGKNTTLSLAANFEYDQSRPVYGTPTGFQDYSTQVTGGNDHKTVLNLVAGVTQSVTRFWLTQLNYSFGTSKGYQTDPYKILSIVDPVSGSPLSYVYENRPRSRTRQSVYWGNRLALGPTVADVSFRYYHDSWGINSITASVSDLIPIGHDFTIEPSFRYYHQGAANFYRAYLLGGAALPDFASADQRLGRFSATTFGAKLTYRLIRDSDWLSDTDVYIAGERYKQTGSHFDSSAPGALSTMDMFAGVSAFSIVAGLKIKL